MERIRREIWRVLRKGETRGKLRFCISCRGMVGLGFSREGVETCKVLCDGLICLSSAVRKNSYTPERENVYVFLHHRCRCRCRRSSVPTYCIVYGSWNSAMSARVGTRGYMSCMTRASATLRHTMTESTIIYWIESFPAMIASRNATPGRKPCYATLPLSHC